MLKAAISAVCRSQEYCELFRGEKVHQQQYWQQ